MPALTQPAMGNRAATVARETPAARNTDNKGAPVNGRRPTVNPATLPGIDDGTRKSF